MGLDKVDKGAPGQQDDDDAASTFMDVIDDSFYFGVNTEEDSGDSQRFPTTYPFSATVPRVGLALLKVLPSKGPRGSFGGRASSRAGQGKARMTSKHLTHSQYKRGFSI